MSTKPGTIRAVEMRLIEDVFEMHGGYVLDFTDRTFGEFFVSDVGIDIDEKRWFGGGTSKAKRLRFFLQNADHASAARALTALWEYREAERRRRGKDETVANAATEIQQVIRRLGGKVEAGAKAAEQAFPGANPRRLFDLAKEYTEVSVLDPQRRGYAYEAFLKRLFDTYGLGARASFRRGQVDQIDGSFQLDGDTYLFEARWRNELADAADTDAFHRKLERGAHWTRGVFISQNGFTEGALKSLRRGTRLICMSAFDIYETLSRGLDLSEVIRRKARHAAETGEAMRLVRDLF